MWQDPIVEEVRQARTKHAEQFNFDLYAIFADLKAAEQRQKNLKVSLLPKRLKLVKTQLDSTASRLE